MDDNSPDGTGEIVKDLRNLYPNSLFIIERQGKLGLGTAYILGFKWALERGYDFVFEMDADFSHNPNDLIRLQDVCLKDKADMAVGSRYVKGGKLENWPWDRIFISFGASLYVRMITLMPVKDPTAGFVCYTRKVLETIDLDKIRFIGYAFQIEMKFATYTLGFKIVEIPITFVERKEGSSKMNSSIVSEAIKGVIQMKWKSFSKNYKHQKQIEE